MTIQSEYSEYMGADWIKGSLKLELSPLGVAAAELLGDVFLGIYHLNTTSLRKVNWQATDLIDFTLDRELATWDLDELTRLVVLAHDRMLRVEIAPCSPRHLKLRISQRKSRTGDTYSRCPTLENHVASLRNHYRTAMIEGGRP